MIAIVIPHHRKPDAMPFEYPKPGREKLPKPSDPTDAPATGPAVGATYCEGHEDGWARGYGKGFRDGVAAPGHRTAAARTAGFLAGIAAGRESMARAFWRGVCEEKAARVRLLACGRDPRKERLWDTGGWWWPEGDWCEEAYRDHTQLRRWATE